MASGLLRRHENVGYEVDVAVDGFEGWNALRTGRYDLLVSDVDMPGMNDIEWWKRLARTRGCRLNAG